MSADAPGRREVAYRLFAAEYDDASLSYSESDEERAPNYVVTPTGARVNRLFAVGVLTEVEQVNEDVLRGRVADPTGAFVTYAGQYQPEAMAFIDRTTPPAFVALTGKARTFEPEDSDRVFTSVRPESVNAVDADTRDRWVVSTAEATLRRVAAFDAALADDRRGDDLERALLAAGVDETLAAGIPRAIDHYGTTTAYLEAVRQLAVDALEVVAGDRDEVRPLTVAPSEGEPTELGPLPSDIERPDLSAVVAEETVETTEAAEAAEAEAPTEPAETVEATAGADSGTEISTEPDSPSSETTETTDPVADESTAAASTESMVEADQSAADTATEPAEAVASDRQETTAESTDPKSTADTEPESAEAAATEPAEATETDGSDALGDFDDTSGDFEESAESADGSDEFDESNEEGLGDFDDGMYELDEEERQEVEEEFGTEFTSGAEVDEPGDADIDVTTGDESAESAESVGSAETSEEPVAAETSAAGSTESVVDDSTESTEDVAAESAEATSPETDDVSSDEADQATDADAEETGEPLDEAGLKAAAVDAMSDLDDGDGADREKVVAAVVDEYGADPGNVEDAIQDALMSGQCYEPADGKLKAI